MGHSNHVVDVGCLSRPLPPLISMLVRSEVQGREQLSRIGHVL
jgi:hypothetical protein